MNLKRLFQIQNISCIKDLTRTCFRYTALQSRYVTVIHLSKEA